MKPFLEGLEKHTDDKIVNDWFCDTLCGEVDTLKRRGIKFGPVQYHGLIDQLLEDEEEIAQFIREFSDDIHLRFVKNLIDGKIEEIFSSFKSRAHDDLKESLMELCKSCAQSAPQSPPQSLLQSIPQIPESDGRSSRERNQEAKSQRKKRGRSPTNL